MSNYWKLEKALKFHITLEMTPQEVHDLGQKEVKRIRKRMEEVYFDNKTIGGFSTFLPI